MAVLGESPELLGVLTSFEVTTGFGPYGCSPQAEPKYLAWQGSPPPTKAEDYSSGSTLGVERDYLNQSWHKVECDQHAILHN